ncbi:MAG: hypothetical protein R3B69_01280 [Candidatus Paceibacterota bacterium]
MFTDDGEFTQYEIIQITRSLTDPNANIPRDEFYTYAIYLTDGSVRRVTVPEFTSIAFLETRFASVGYQGNVLQLIALAEDVAPTEAEQSFVDVILDIVGVSATTLANIFDFGRDDTPAETYTDLSDSTPTNDGLIDMDDIKSAIVYFGVDANCPNAPGLDQSYLYEIIIAKEALYDSQRDVALRVARCGAGDKWSYVNAIASHLESQPAFGNIDRTVLYDMILFGDLRNLALIEPEVSEDTEFFSEPDDSSEEHTAAVVEIPNRTNTVEFEARVTNNTGAITTDWTTGNLTVNQSDALSFRWEAGDYERCLPFLQDNGGYAFSYNDGAMTRGNTEVVGYTVPTQSGTYYIECAGQNNGEFGVDVKAIDIAIQ